MVALSDRKMQCKCNVNVNVNVNIVLAGMHGAKRDITPGRQWVPLHCSAHPLTVTKCQKLIIQVHFRDLNHGPWLLLYRPKRNEKPKISTPSQFFFRNFR